MKSIHLPSRASWMWTWAPAVPITRHRYGASTQTWRMFLQKRMIKAQKNGGKLGRHVIPCGGKETSVFLTLEMVSTTLFLYSREGSEESTPLPRANLAPASRNTAQSCGRFLCQQEASLPPTHYYWSRLELGVWLAQLPGTPCQWLQVLAAALALLTVLESARKYNRNIFFFSV